jgi:hypothetical protein
VNRGIEQAVYRYAWGFDSDDMAVLGSAFTEDAEYLGVGEPLRGRDAICAFLARIRTARRERKEQTRHMTTNILVLEEHAEVARVVSYFTVVVSGGEELVIGSSGWYEDTIVVRDGTWQIQTRTAHRDLPMP